LDYHGNIVKSKENAIAEYNRMIEDSEKAYFKVSYPL